MYGHYWWIMPLFVAISTSGCVNGTVMTTSRMFFAASQQNQMPKILSFLHVTHLTPIPSVVFTPENWASYSSCTCDLSGLDV
ncbi:hypothetical protein T265_14967 [Opisthorchis viverrini]|uniref:Amino acid permease/ SLC12A domain-containing protein n=1 Tax=Opisthorchis viverrini TaxID=6198 RepID=A0A074Z4G4_OPIVI|nr:hypothetical protein T265_14967 [Opisthorchis viverrini]KER21958.1 hypothetical protein T265_14967 [Opisthorchis viverrini]